MTRRREIERHRRKLCEIRGVMESMKTLAYMETHKLARFIEAQHALARNIEDIAVDFIHFYPQVLPHAEPSMEIILLIGSQRGFCGDFNESLLKHLQLSHDYHRQHASTVIAIGQKLHPLLENESLDCIFIEGANVAEEISNVVGQLARTLLAYKQSFLSLYVLHHTDKDNGIISERLLPPFSHFPQQKTPFNHSPLLNLPAEIFILELTEHALFIALQRILYSSLMAENQHRVQHLENAVNHLDNKTNELTRKSNTLRQEEIIEEIEIILLNASVT